jgi:hypothetical protein
VSTESVIRFRRIPLDRAQRQDLHHQAHHLRPLNSAHVPSPASRRRVQWEAAAVSVAVAARINCGAVRAG